MLIVPFDLEFSLIAHPAEGIDRDKKGWTLLKFFAASITNDVEAMDVNNVAIRWKVFFLYILWPEDVDKIIQ